MVHFNLKNLMYLSYYAHNIINTVSIISEWNLIIINYYLAIVSYLIWTRYTKVIKTKPVEVFSFILIKCKTG
jgi:hypothetical protein